jgi:hypothetical protein
MFGLLLDNCGYRKHGRLLTLQFESWMVGYPLIGPECGWQPSSESFASQAQQITI